LNQKKEVPPIKKELQGKLAWKTPEKEKQCGGEES